MTNYAYIRISDAHKQSTKQQEFIIKEYAKDNGMLLEQKNVFIHKISGSKSNDEERGLNDMIERLDEGDYLLVSDIDRLGRDRATGILGAIDRVIMKKANLVFCRPNIEFNLSCHNDPGKLFMMMGEAFAAVRFAEERSKKAKAAASIRAENLLPNGRKKGEFVSSKLDEFEYEIIAELSQGVQKKVLAKNLGVTRATLYRWLDMREAVRKLAKKHDLEAARLTELKPKLREIIRAT